MPQREIMKLVRGVFKGFWKRHVTNVGLLTSALLLGRRAGVAALGRQLDVDTTPKHAIKRVDRFLGNPRFRLLDAWEALLPWVVGPRREVVMACDWTKVRQWSVLSASVIYRGRALPMLWAVMDLHQLQKSLNSFEHGFFIARTIVTPAGKSHCVTGPRVQAGRVDSASGAVRVFLCDPFGRQYFNKASALPWTDAGSYHRAGSAPRFEERSLTQNPAGPHPCGGSLGEGPSRTLVLDHTLPARAIARLYGKRFQIEETFRDQKCSRLGFGLSEITMHSAERLKKLLLIVALAQLLALFVGAIARQRGLDRGFRANTGHQQTTHSDFTLGLYYLWRIHWTLRELIKLRALEPCSLFGG